MMIALHILVWSGFSLIIAYAWWIKVRVWLYRQELFHIRDALWAKMRNDDMLDDPAHRQVRDGINALIRFAPHASVSTFREFAGIPRQIDLIHPNSMPHEVQEALREAIAVSVRYILFRTASGWLFLAQMILQHHRRAFNIVVDDYRRKVKQAFNTHEMRSADWEGALGA